MSRKFTIVIEQQGNFFVASCKEMPEATAKADSKKAVLEKIKAVIEKKLGDDSEGGASMKPHPKSPVPRGPIIVAESHELPE